MKLSFTGTPPIPPFLLRSSAIISAAALPGTPNTDAGPDKNVVMAILISDGLSWACAVAANIAAAAKTAAAVDLRRMHFLLGCECDCFAGMLLVPCLGTSFVDRLAATVN